MRRRALRRVSATFICSRRALDRGVEHLVADDDADAADQRRVDLTTVTSRACGRSASPARLTHGRPAASRRSGTRCRRAARETPLRSLTSARNCARDLGQRRQAAVVDHACAASSSPACRAARSARRDAGDQRRTPASTSTFGLSANWRSCASPAMAASASSSRREPRGVAVAGRLEQRLGVRAGDGGEFGHGRVQSSVCRRPSRSACDAGVDFPAQDLLGALDGQRGDLLAQRFARLARLPARLRRARRRRSWRPLRWRAPWLPRSSPAPGARRRPGAAAASLRAVDSSSSTRLLAAASSALALSAADRPSAIFCARSSSAAVIGGQTNFIVNPTRIRNTII